jgi:hypothetical protein
VVKVEIVCLGVAGFGHVESGFGHCVAAALLTGVVGAAGIDGPGAGPLFQEAAEPPVTGDYLAATSACCW